MYGTYGNILTEELLQDRADLFGEQVTGFEDFIRENWMRRRTSDCVGLIKGYGWYNPDSGEIVVGTNGMAGEKRLDEIMTVIEKHLGIN